MEITFCKSQLKSDWNMEDMEAWGMDTEFMKSDEILDELDLDSIELPNVGENTVRGILVPVRQEDYDDAFAIFHQCVKAGMDVGAMFFDFLKAEHSKIAKETNK